MIQQLPDDNVLLPLRDRLADWEDHDVAGFFLGKALGLIPVDTSWGKAKGMFWSDNPTGLIIIDILRYLIDNGVIEERDTTEYGIYRWNNSAQKRSDS